MHSTSTYIRRLLKLKNFHRLVSQKTIIFFIISNFVDAAEDPVGGLQESRDEGGNPSQFTLASQVQLILNSFKKATN